MDYKEILKKYWFTAIIAILLLGGLIFFIGSTLSNKVSSLVNADGQSVVFTYEDQEYTADELYNEVYDTFGIGAILPVFELEVYKGAGEVTKAIESDAKLQTDMIIQNLKAQFGESWKDRLDLVLYQTGYLTNTGEKGLHEYITIELIREQIEKDYVLANKSYETYFNENGPRLVSHILVRMTDPENPTEEELAKLEEVKAAVAAEGAIFSEVASKYSDDGSREQGGSLGIVTKESNKQFVEEFQNLTYSVGTNETTAWFKTQFGYHIIRVDATTLEDFLALGNQEIMYNLFQDNPKLRLEITWDQIQKQGITFGNDEKLNKDIIEHYTGTGA